MEKLGLRIRAARILAEMSQKDLGAACGYSQSQISRFESGVDIPSTAQRRALAGALHISPAVLGVAGESEDDVRRRDVLSAMVGIGTTSVIPTASAAPGPGWQGALFEDRSTAMPAAQVEAGLDAVAQDCSFARYREAAAAIPKLISAAETRARHGGAKDTLLVSRAYVLATAVAVKERGDLSWITADRAVRAARRAQHPLGQAQAARAQFIVLRQNGHHRWAQELARTTVSELADEDLARPVVGHILLEAAYGEAQAGRASEATALLDHARDLARKGPSTTVWPDHAGPLSTDQVERYGLCVQHQLGNTKAALAHLARIDARAVATPERRARVRHDSAKLFRDLGDLPRALQLLREQEEETPQDTRRTSVRYMVSGMLNTSPALPGLRTFAEEIGAA